MSGHSFVNWGRNQRCEPSDLATPSSEAALVDLVAAVHRRGGTLKVVGAGHSWSDVACTDGVLVSLDGLRDVHEVDAEEGLVTVGAGIRLKELNELLPRHGLAMEMLGSVAEQSVAGAMSTGTHGSGIGFGNIATQVVALRIVLGDGRVVDADAVEHSEIFRAARVGVGCIGIVMRVTLRCVPAFTLEERSAPMPLPQLLERLPEVIHRAPYVKVWWLPHTGIAQVFEARPTTRPPNRRVWEQPVEQALNDYLFAGMLRAGAALPAIVPGINRLVQRAYLTPRVRVERSDRIFNLAMPPVHRETEYAVPVEAAADAIGALSDLIERQRLRVNFIVEARFVAGDDAYLSPAFERDSCHLGAYMADGPHLGAYFGGFERLMLGLDGRPHWGKEVFAAAEDVRVRCPGFERFSAIRDEADPGRVFDNRFSRWLFG